MTQPTDAGIGVEDCEELAKGMDAFAASFPALTEPMTRAARILRAHAAALRHCAEPVYEKFHHTYPYLTMTSRGQETFNDYEE